MCKEFFDGLFGNNKPAPVAAPAAQPSSVAVTRESRGPAVVKSDSELATSKPKNKIAGGGNSSIGIAIGTPDTPRKRTTELGL